MMHGQLLNFLPENHAGHQLFFIIEIKTKKISNDLTFLGSEYNFLRIAIFKVKKIMRLNRRINVWEYIYAHNFFKYIATFF